MAKPCPFCGGTLLFLNRIARDVAVEEDTDPAVYYIHCDACDGEGPLGMTEELAWQGWNTRV